MGKHLMLKQKGLSLAVAIMLGTSIVGFSGQAAAFGLGDIGIGDSQAGAASNFDIDGLSNKQEAMLDKLYDSVVLFNSAVLEVEVALELAPEIVIEQQAICDNLNADKTNQEYLKKAANHKIPFKEIKAASQAILASGDQERIAAIDQAVRSAEMKKQSANVYTGFALKDAVDVIKEGATGMKGFDGAVKVQGIVSSAQTAQKICNSQNKQISEFNNALKSYKESQNIQAPSEQEAITAAEIWLKDR